MVFNWDRLCGGRYPWLSAIGKTLKQQPCNAATVVARQLRQRLLLAVLVFVLVLRQPQHTAARNAGEAAAGQPINAILSHPGPNTTTIPHNNPTNTYRLGP